MSNADLAERLFAGLAAGDAAAVGDLCADDFRGYQNAGPAMDLATLMNFTRAVLGVVEGFRYEEAIRSATATGFVEEHRVRGTLPDGSALDIAACVVGEVRDGRVVELREYLDSRAATPLLKALA
jgi:Ketosteroid isomerase-related protein